MNLEKRRIKLQKQVDDMVKNQANLYGSSYEEFKIYHLKFYKKLKKLRKIDEQIEVA
jgi:hypothetical protein